MLKRLPEIWGGLEGTVNRVRDRYFDQCRRNGHRERIDDLERFRALGIQALRYPLLWEVVAPERLEDAEFSAFDAPLARLRELSLRPILGLVHHGSGPRHTSLLDPRFGEKLSAYAARVAERYPFVEDYTPVNEPLTTARFSCLYGHWYPHRRDYASFARALVNQCRGVVLAMRAVRAVNPRARLVATDDMGRTYSTARLEYQARFENEQRWLSFDLLCGKVDPEHPLYEHLVAHGIRPDELEFFREHAAAPAVIGLNYYLTSDRLLDERLADYPERTHGGNGRERYADVEAVRAWPAGITGHRALLDAAWARYGLPVAFTEVHLGCTREEQLRWLREAWEATVSARSCGVDARAITVWALLGAFDWNSLVTEERGFYESGAFDVRGRPPRPTAITRMTRALTQTGTYSHPVLLAPGWWRRPDRIHCGAFACDSRPTEDDESVPPLLITGATGTLGRAFARLCRVRGIRHRLLARDELDIADPGSIAAALDRHQPWGVVNAAGYVRVDDAELDHDRCFRENTRGPALLARACAGAGVRLVTFSTDLVFSGDGQRPYRESDPAQPLNTYGRSKAAAEQLVLEALPTALVVRTSAFFGPWDVHHFVHHALSALRRGERFAAAADLVVSPTYVPDLVNATLDLLIDEEHGLWHVSNEAALSWAELAAMAAELAGLCTRLVQPVPAAALKLSARRPAFSALGSERGQLLPPLEDALSRYWTERTPDAA